ncbi:MAG: thioredoxin domain-containing protein [Actinomycetaceae bacterium]|nr:thioredoxin domain-containing protein [Actinomycetaceae bacterium]
MSSSKKARQARYEERTIEAKAAKMRLEQQQKDKRNRLIMVGVVGLLVLALIVVLVIVLGGANNGAKGGNGDSSKIAGTKDAISYAEPASYPSGRGIWVGPNGALSNEEITEALKSKKPIIEFFFSFDCNICADLTTHNHDDLADAAASGKALVVYRPEITHGTPYATVASNAIIHVAEHQPTAFPAVLKALTEYSDPLLNSATLEKTLTSKDPDITSEDGAVAKVTQLVTAAGGDLQGATGLGSQDYLMTAGKIMTDEREVRGTPTLFVDGKRKELTNQFIQGPGLATYLLEGK